MTPVAAAHSDSGELAGDEGQAKVSQEEVHYKALGVIGIPSFFLNGH